MIDARTGPVRTDPQLRRRRSVGALTTGASVGLLLCLASCAGGDVGAEQIVGVADAATSVPPERRDVRTVVEPVAPAVAPVAPPDGSLLNATGDVVAESLGDLASPDGGIDVVGATCETEGGELDYNGTTGTDVFDIEDDGSGTFSEESPSGLTTLEVGADGSGNYYDETAAGLLTIAVQPDQSGEYYSKQAEDLVTVKVEADGTGEYYSKADDRLLTVTLHGDGSGRLVDETDNRTVTIDAAGDGSGQFYRQTADRLVTIEKDANGGWEFVETTPSRLLTLTVEPDGSGHYDQAGLVDVEFDFDAEGRGPNGERIELPPTPEFSVAAEFPPLGTLGSLAPPCATVIRLDSQVLFDYNEAVLKPGAGPTLADVVTTLQQTDEPIDIVGHTDSIGTDEHNLDLSLRRARAVEAALVQRGLTVHTTVEGRGEVEPVAPNETPDGRDDPAGRALNRRVEITIRD